MHEVTAAGVDPQAIHLPRAITYPPKHDDAPFAAASADNPTHVAAFDPHSVHIPVVASKKYLSAHDYINPTVEVASIPVNAVHVP